MQTKTVVLIGALGLLAGWYAGSSSVSQTAAPSTGANTVRPRSPLGSTPREPLAPYTEQLRLKLQEQPRSPAPGRNPFVFGSRRPAPSMSGRAPRAERQQDEELPPPPPPVPEGPRFLLSGIAANQVNGATTWTAIVVDNGQLVFVSTGDKLSGGYTVTKVDETSATVVDAKGGEIVLRLR